MIQNLNCKNVIIFLFYAQILDENNLEKKCWEGNDFQTEQVLASDTFTEINYSVLESILARQTLNVKKVSQF